MLSLTDLFPRTRAEVLRLLFEAPDQTLHLRDLARLAGLSPAALQKELDALERKELITARRDGNRRYFRANTAHPLYPELHGLVVKTAGIASELRRALAPVDGIALALIFGSTAAGTARGASDVDVLVIGSAGLRKIGPALRGVADTLAREINPVCLTPAEWRTKLLARDAFATRVASEPKLLLKGDPDELAAMGL
ncbi:MarR family transcriptional regulator [Luteolibacter arcticus]|uniref:MarR family transcriptional regulator n=1 Tax=Luteolibacter arcticus TaxID=1581411 RepID=A0ABT3GSN6_9BACT|nr:MarR family transcriptional regulator [Luteolibacter arcticus]MCW1926530.1 MarR family transcriptional regulator [Luteolibacter arcticus]